MRFYLPLLIVALMLVLGACTGGRDLTQDPDAEVHYTLGLSYLREPNPSMALKSFLDAEKLAPNDPKIQDALAQAYMKKKAYKEAEKCFKRALDLSDDNPQYQNNLAAMYLEVGRYDEAIDYFDRAASNLFFSQPEHAYVGKGYALFKKHNYLEAISAYNKALGFNPRYALAHYRLGEAYFALDKTPLALESYSRALDLAPQSAVVHYRKGVALVKARKVTEAKESFRQVVKLDPAGEYGRQAADYLKILK